MWCVTLAQIFGFYKGNHEIWVWEIISIHWTYNGEHEIWVWEMQQHHWICIGNHEILYEKSSQSIGLAMENMRFALEIMRYCMRNHPNPLDLQWRTWDLSMRNAAIPLDLHWNPWDFVWEIIPIHWTCNGEHEVWVWETLDYGTCIPRFITTWQREDPECIRRQRSKRCSHKQGPHLPSR